MRIRTALVTARSAPAHERAIQTLMSWNIAVDEAMPWGLPKGEFCASSSPTFDFFDDQTGHCARPRSMYLQDIEQRHHQSNGLIIMLTPPPDRADT